MLSMRHIRALGLVTVITVGALATVAGAAKGGGGGGGGVVPPVVGGVAANLKASLTPVAGLPACTGAETNTTANPGVCQTAAPLLVDPALGAIPIPAGVLQGAKARLHMPAIDPAKFPVTGCVAQYTLGSVTATGALIAALAPEVGNIADFRTNLAAGTLKVGDPARIDVVCNFASAPVLGRRGVVISPGTPMHTETHFAGLLV
jgi:hypothetical protein